MTASLRLHRPQSLLAGMNRFLSLLEITFRRDPKNFRPRINKLHSIKARTDCEFLVRKYNNTLRTSSCLCSRTRNRRRVGTISSWKTKNNLLRDRVDLHEKICAASSSATSTAGLRSDKQQTFKNNLDTHQPLCSALCSIASDVVRRLNIRNR